MSSEMAPANRQLTGPTAQEAQVEAIKSATLQELKIRYEVSKDRFSCGEQVRASFLKWNVTTGRLGGENDGSAGQRANTEKLQADAGHPFKSLGEVVDITPSLPTVARSVNTKPA